MPQYRYPWPASAISPADMAALHRARESSRPRIPISKLIAQAIRATYGQAVLSPPDPATHQDDDERKAA